MKAIHKEKQYMEREYFEGEFDLERPKGIIYDKKPFKVKTGGWKDVCVVFMRT